MKNLNGLWKVEDGKVLVQLHGAETINYHATQNIRSVKCILRVIQGNWRARDAVSPLVLISVLPKHGVKITIIDVSFHHTHDADYYSIEGVVERKDRYEYGPGLTGLTTKVKELLKSECLYMERVVWDIEEAT